MAEKFELKSEPAVSQPSLPMQGEGVRNSVRQERRKRDSARLVWDSKPKRPPSPRDIEFQTAEVVIPNPARDAGTLPFATHHGVVDREIDRSKMNRLITATENLEAERKYNVAVRVVDVFGNDAAEAAVVDI